MKKNKFKIPNLKLKRSWIITIILTCFTISLGIWARHTSINNRTYFIHGASGEEATEWAEKAKKDKWVEIVELDFEEKEIYDKVWDCMVIRQVPIYRSIPNRKIDDYIRDNETVSVRQWVPRQKAANWMYNLHIAGWTNADKMATKYSEEASKQDRIEFWLTVGFFICLMVTLIYGIITFRQHQKK